MTKKTNKDFPTEAEITDLVIASQDEQKKKLTVLQQSLVEAYTDDDSPTRFQKMASVRAAGYGTHIKWSQVFPGVKDAIIEQTKSILAEAGPQAASQLIKYITHPEDAGGREQLQAIQLLFDRIGVVKSEKIEVEVTHNAVFVLPPKKEQEAIEVDFETVKDE
jgi:hypothetical protein